MVVSTRQITKERLAQQPQITPEDIVPGVLYFDHERKQWWHACARCGSLGHLDSAIYFDEGEWPSVGSSIWCNKCYAHYWYSDLSMAVYSDFPEAGGRRGWDLRAELLKYLRPRMKNHLEWFRFWHTPIDRRKKNSPTPWILMQEKKDDEVRSFAQRRFGKQKTRNITPSQHVNRMHGDGMAVYGKRSMRQYY